MNSLGNNSNERMIELQEVNDNLAAQITEYNKLIKRLYDDPLKVCFFLKHKGLNGIGSWLWKEKNARRY